MSGWELRKKVWNLIEEVIKKRKTCLEVINGNKYLRNQWLDIKKGILQSDTYPPVGFCCTDITVMMLLKESAKWAHQVKERLNIRPVYL